jgi:hypothetical protein
MASQYAMILCMTRFGTRNFRPNPIYYEGAERIADDAGVSINVLLQALLRELLAEPEDRLAALEPHLAAVAAETPRRGRPSSASAAEEDDSPGSGT